MSKTEINKRNDYLVNFALMEWYLNRNEIIINKSPDIIIKEMEKELSDLDTNSSETLNNIVIILASAYGHKSYLEDFPIIMRSSFFVSCFSKFEIILANICDSFRTEQKIDIAYTDLHGGGDIGKCYIYLKKSSKIRIKEWRRALAVNAKIQQNKKCNNT